MRSSNSAVRRPVINEKGGVYVVEVDPEGAAHAAGIRKGDVIIGIQELSIDNSSKLLEEIAKHRPNDKVTVKIKRGSDVKQMEVVLRNKSGNTGIVKRRRRRSNRCAGRTIRRHFRPRTQRAED